MEERKTKGIERCGHVQIACCVQGSEEGMDDWSYILLLDEGLRQQNLQIKWENHMFMDNVSVELNAIMRVIYLKLSYPDIKSRTRSYSSASDVRPELW